MLLEEPETLDAELVQEEEAEAKAEAERARPGLTLFTDEYGWRTGQPAMLWSGSGGSPGRH